MADVFDCLRGAVRPRRSFPWEAVSYTLGAALFVTFAVVLTLAQYEIYKKKYGDHMTFTDFILDSTR